MKTPLQDGCELTHRSGEETSPLSNVLTLATAASFRDTEV